jgi:hypothetical protein
MTDAAEGAPGQGFNIVMVLGGVAILGVAALAVGSFVLSSPAPLVHMALSQQPSEASFTLDDEATVQVWANLDVYHDGISHNAPNDSLPHVVDYAVELAGPGGPVTLRCNPFDSNFAWTSGTHKSVGAPSGRYYDGRLTGCAAKLAAGTWILRAQLVPVQADERIRFVRTELILRR